VLNEAGEKMSKRNGAKPVTQYRDEGYLPDAMINYLARLGWSHGDDEIFSREQFLDWFNLDHLGKSAAQFDEAKLRWVNAQHLKAMDPERLAELVRPRLAQRGIAPDPQLAAICALFKDRCDTTVALADWVAVFYSDVHVDPEVLQPMLNPEVHQAITALAKGASHPCSPASAPHPGGVLRGDMGARIGLPQIQETDQVFPVPPAESAGVIRWPHQPAENRLGQAASVPAAA
jgi:glutamyl-tRNA synthetase